MHGEAQCFAAMAAMAAIIYDVFLSTLGCKMITSYSHVGNGFAMTDSRHDT